MPEPQAFIDRLKVLNLPELQLGRSEIVVFVGPNNGGKSFCLDTIFALAAKKRERSEIGLRLGIQGTANEMWERLSRTPGAIIKDTTLHGPGWSISKDELEKVWSGSSLEMEPHRHSLNFLQQLFVRIPLDARAQISGTKILESAGEGPSQNDQNSPVSMIEVDPVRWTADRVN